MNRKDRFARCNPSPVHKSNTPPLLQERELTDGSLVIERGRTDESLGDLRNKTERETDEKVKSDRQEADDARAQNRAETDIDAFVREAESGGFQANNKTEEHQVLEDRLNEQRQSDDDVAGTERLLMDAAIRNERAQKETLLNQLLHKERGETDENLLRERQHTDSEVQRHSELLTNEQSSHSETKAALTTRDEFLAIVSHDLRNPIGTIIAFANLLLEDSAAAQMGDESKKWVEVIKRNAKTSLRLIGDILDMERFAEGKLELQLGRHNVQDLVEQSVESFVHIAAENQIFLRAIPLDVGAVGICDRDRVAQVLSNLIGNALKFTPAGGSVTVRVQQTEKELHVSVSDTGPGIPIEQQRRIFDRFAQIKNKDRRGLGLGLYISKMLIEAHRGQLWVVSAPGVGSNFCFTLPKQDRTMVRAGM
jgi:signal transduction histidine kinase